VAVRRRDVEEPLRYSDSGVTLSTVRTSAMYRVLCDRCDRASAWSEELPTVIPLVDGHPGRYDSSHEGFYISRRLPSHLAEDLCSNCYLCGNNFEESRDGLPPKDSLWWSRERPRHVAKVVLADDRTTVFYVLYHPDRIITDSKEQPLKQASLDTRDFRQKYLVPMPDKEECQPGRVWASAQMMQKDVVVRSWGDEVVVESNHSVHTYPPPQFLDHFVPTTACRCRTWLERLVEDELV
jgi:hypothetical protein